MDRSVRGGSGGSAAVVVGFAEDDADALGGEPDGVGDHVSGDSSLECVADRCVSGGSCRMGGGQADGEGVAGGGELTEGVADVHARIIFNPD